MASRDRTSADDSAAPGSVEAVGGAVFGNSFRTAEPWAASTGFRTFPLRHESSHTASHRVAEEFLVNTRLRRRDSEFEASVGTYFTPSGGLMTSLLGEEGRQGSVAVELPDSHTLKMSIGETVDRRRSIRSYTGDAIGLRYLATMLRIGNGITAPGGENADPSPSLRSTPSGGGLHPVSIHLAALRVDGLARGTYAYDPCGDRLWKTGDEEVVEELVGAVAAPDEAIMTSNAVAFLLLIGRPWRAMRKYGDRGMRHVFIEAGMIAEHLHLAAAGLGIGTVDCASFYDDEVHQALEIDGVYETLVHALVVGVPA